ncbi:MAG: hypothetical protein H0X27_13400 [Caulobacteraceae bacterium]|nr:hypothetical protein [Caulobacteraceae bacterium]
MTTKTISTYVAGGYDLSPSYSELDITTKGGVGGSGVYSDHFATISNFGTINETTDHYGIHLKVGGNVFNQPTGLVQGNIGVDLGAAGTVTNLGTIIGQSAGIFMEAGGAVTNGAYANPDALIEGRVAFLTSAGTLSNFGTIVATVRMQAGGAVTNGGAGDTTASIVRGGGVAMSGGVSTVKNFGTIQGYGRPGSSGVYISSGLVTNGGATATEARIEGYTGVIISGAATVTNFGVITGDGAAGISFFNGGSLTNGTDIDRHALVEGYSGVVVSSTAGTIANFGTIQGLDVGGSGRYGVLLHFGGSVTNGSSTDRSALVQGDQGVLTQRVASTVVNFGTILGEGAYNRGAVVLYAGGSVTNGSDLDGTALIEGASGVQIEGGAGTIRNFGTIRATGAYGAGLVLFAGGSLTNGSAADGAALIEGGLSVGLFGAAATNFGTISGVGAPDGTGVYLHSGSTLTNGASGHAGALVQGYLGVRVSGTGTVTNFGTIRGMGAPAVYFASSADTLIVEAGCAFEGAVLGGGGTLELDTGVGALTGLLAGGNVTVSGSMAATTFSDFATVEIGPSATFASSGAVTIAAGQTVNDAGSLTLGGGKKGSVANAGLIETTGAGVLTIRSPVVNTGILAADGGTLTVMGAVTGGSGRGNIDGGTLDFTAGFNQNVKFTGTTGILELAQSQSYGGTILGFSKTGGTSLDLDDIAFGAGTKATYAGNKSGGVLTVTDGSHTAQIDLKGDYRSSTFVVAADGHGGTLVHDPASLAANLPPPSQRFIAAMAGLGGGGAGLEAGPAWRPHSPAMLLCPRVQIA